LKTVKQIGLTIPPERAGAGGQGNQMKQNPSRSLRTSFGFAILD